MGWPENYRKDGAVMETTSNLKIPLISGDKPLLRKHFNEALQAIDDNALPRAHAKTKAHFEMWNPNTEYKKQDIVRTSACPSWGFFVCESAGKSAQSEPIGYGIGDKVLDGGVGWVLKGFGTGDSSHAVIFVGSDLNTVYPYSGLVDFVTILLATPQNLDLSISLLKMPAADFTAQTGTWTPINGASFVLPKGSRYKKFQNLTQNTTVNEGDVLRVGALENDTGLTITINIK
jgi:hypothetical protein